MSLSVIIPYTFGDTLRETNLANLLNSINAQSLPNFELIIVEELVDSTTEEKAPYHPKINKYITLKDHRKFNKSWCINVGVRNCKYDNILVLDADMLFGKDYFSKVMDFSKLYPKFFNGFNYISLMPGRDNPVCRILPFNNQTIIGGSWFTNKNFFFDELGGFNEDYFGYGGEDNDTGERVKYLLKKIPELPYPIIHQYHDWHIPTGANPLNPNRMAYLLEARKNPANVIAKLKSKKLGNSNYPTLIYSPNSNMNSQSGEERIIIKYLNKNPSTYKGKYIDIGGGHPTQISNSYYFYCMGWRGIVVEPLIEYASLYRKERNEDIYIQKAISDFSGRIKICHNVAINTNVGNYYLENFPNEAYETDCITIEELIKDNPAFIEPDFINIDVEGSEEKILSKCNFNTFKPKIILIEFWFRGKNEEGKIIDRMDYRSKWEKYLLPHYDFKEVIGGNAIYTRKS
jgi:FkbM family methyltransferase